MKEKIVFSKYHGNGNDFILIDNTSSIFSQKQLVSLSKKLCNRNFFIGADGLIALEKREGLFYMNYFNSDGSKSLMCGNGIRCTARFIIDENFLEEFKSSITINTGAGEKNIIIDGVIDKPEDLIFKVNMGKPIFNSKSLPMYKQQPVNIDTKYGTFQAYYTSMGNPHCAIFLDKDVYSMDNFQLIGEEIENRTSLFSEKTNVEFVNILDKSNIKIRVWERGCCETLSCGTGACATGVLSAIYFNTDSILTVSTKGGNLKIEWNKETDEVFLSGKSSFVFKGEILTNKIL